MRQTKYIVFRGEKHGTTVAAFPDHIEHAEFARAVRDTLGDPLAGGFVQWTDEGPTAYGESISLKLKSRGDVDTALLRRLLA